MLHTSLDSTVNESCQQVRSMLPEVDTYDVILYSAARQYSNGLKAYRINVSRSAYSNTKLEAIDRAKRLDKSFLITWDSDL